MQTVVFEQLGGIGLLTLNRPDSSNALNPELLAALYHSTKQLAGPEVRAIVLTGAGRNFCAGADLDVAARCSESMDLRSVFHPVLLAVSALDKPVIAAINGAAAGGGLSLALAADIRIMADDARLVPAWGEIGLVPDFGASYFAARLLGEARAYEWLATGEVFDADKAVDLGLARARVTSADLAGAALALAENLASKAGNAVGLAKRLVAGSGQRSLAEQLELEIATQALAVSAPGRTEQVSKRMANFYRVNPDE